LRRVLTTPTEGATFETSPRSPDIQRSRTWTSR
jgi:hypothetical protein